MPSLTRLCLQVVPSIRRAPFSANRELVAKVVVRSECLTFYNVAEDFTQQEWQLLDPDQKDLFWEVMLDLQPPGVSGTSIQQTRCAFQGGARGRTVDSRG
ncbi:zinc finger protein 525-like [Saccopteryx leptura]|uniref:zinc finger protein 525-like n=1 Tax=Saccopteryx leptura TaxID=249018 RepID=UPI00339BC76C